jgi:hypothetical protein
MGMECGLTVGEEGTESGGFTFKSSWFADLSTFGFGSCMVVSLSSMQVVAVAIQRRLMKLRACCRVMPASQAISSETWICGMRIGSGRGFCRS